MVEKVNTSKIIILLVIGGIFLVHSLTKDHQNEPKLDFQFWKNGNTLANAIKQRKANRLLKIAPEEDLKQPHESLRQLQSENSEEMENEKEEAVEEKEKPEAKKEESGGESEQKGKESNENSVKPSEEEGEKTIE